MENMQDLLNNKTITIKELNKTIAKMYNKIVYLEKAINLKNIYIEDIEHQNKIKNFTIVDLENELKQSKKNKLNIDYNYFKN